MKKKLFFIWLCTIGIVVNSVAELHHFYAALAPALGINFDVAPAPAAPAAPAPAPTLLYSKTKFSKRTKV
jgi:hypothetical protein